ncbi:MAG TPA: photosystem II reaction center protein PsbM [Leptolyngbyaceae cyanobacterium]
MQVNDLGFLASILFVLVPSVFLLILYIQTATREGGKKAD